VGSYSGSFFVNSVAFYLLAMAAFRKEMLDANASAEAPRRLRRSCRWASAVFGSLRGSPLQPLAGHVDLHGIVGFFGRPQLGTNAPPKATLGLDIAYASC
jgi:hypothetical protein